MANNTDSKKKLLPQQKKFLDAILKAKKDYKEVKTTIKANGGAEKTISVYGPEGYAGKIIKYIEAISKSKYGQDMLTGLAKNKRGLVIFYAHGWASINEKDEFDHILKPKTPTSYMIFDPDMLANNKKARFTLEKGPVKVPTGLFEWDGWSSTKNLYYQKLKPVMSFAHELFHAWQNTGTAPDRKYFPGSFKLWVHTRHGAVGRQNSDFKRLRKEVNAIRYTNQIRIELGLNYVRKHYEPNLRNFKDDTWYQAKGRMKQNPPKTK